jgi:hypothetical protein
MVCPLNQFEIVTLKTGVKSLRSLERQETFHPGIGPSVEAKILYVDQQRLMERVNSPSRPSAEPFVIWDIGFGAGANVLTAIEALQDCNREIEIHSFDKTTAPIEFALTHSEDLTYLRGHEESVRRLLSEGEIDLPPLLSDRKSRDVVARTFQLPLPVPARRIALSADQLYAFHHGEGHSASGRLSRRHRMLDP